MTPPRFMALQRVFARARALSGADRCEYLAQACGDDEALRSAALELLAQDVGPVHEPTASDTSSDDAEVAYPRGLLGAKVGSFVLTRPIGRGGFGVVFEATRDFPRHTAAVKLIRPPAFADPGAWRRLILRFELEANILGRLSYPGIAHIYEAGTVDVGDGPQPYIAMELVRGVTLAAFVAGRRTDPTIEARPLDVRQRLELLALVADAVHHAHQRSVIHRDLKPANILVADDGTPKIVDFGVARVLDPVASSTRHTAAGQLVGTLPYMSPEQIRGRPEDLDTRSDIYSLGAVAFELLSGRVPHDLHGRHFAEAARIITEQSPPRLGSLDRRLRGDIETIVAKAMELDREQRYASAHELAADIRRHLSDAPILAQPSGAWVRLRKLARRNPLLVGACGALGVALALGIVGTSLQAARASAAARRAESKAAIAKSAVELAASLSAAMLPKDERARAVERERAMRQFEESYAANRAQLLPEDLLSLAAVLNSYGLATITNDADTPETALRFFEEALCIRAELLGENDNETIQTMLNIGWTLGVRDRTGELEAISRRALAALDSRAAPDARMLDQALNYLGRTLFLRQAWTLELETVARRELAASRKHEGPTSGWALMAACRLGRVLLNRGKLEAAADVLQQVIRDASDADPNVRPVVVKSCLLAVDALEALAHFEKADALLASVMGRAIPLSFSAADEQALAERRSCLHEAWNAADPGGDTDPPSPLPHDRHANSEPAGP